MSSRVAAQAGGPASVSDDDGLGSGRRRETESRVAASFVFPRTTHHAALTAADPPSRPQKPTLHSTTQLMINFDNRGSKVMSDSVSAKIQAVLAQYVFQVPAKQVFQVCLLFSCGD